MIFWNYIASLSISYMCGIVAIYNNQSKFDKDIRAKSLSMSKKVRHRGPDWSGIYISEHAVLAHERLSIVDIKSGKQPLISTDGNLVLTINGEIYNHLKLREKLKKLTFLSRVDSSGIFP